MDLDTVLVLSDPIYFIVCRVYRPTNFLLFLSFSIGHGGSDGLHGYVPSLDHVVADTVSYPLFYFLFFSIHSAIPIYWAISWQL